MENTAERRQTMRAGPCQRSTEYHMQYETMISGIFIEYLWAGNTQANNPSCPEIPNRLAVPGQSQS